MRNDNYTSLMAKFHDSFDSFGIKKTDIKDVINVNLGKMTQLREETIPYLGDSIRYKDTVNEIEYIAFAEGPVYVFPENSDFKYYCNNSKNALGLSLPHHTNHERIQVLKVINNNIITEDYYPNQNKFVIQVYDESVLSFLATGGYAFNNINTIPDTLTSQGILPDKKVTIENNMIITEVDGVVYPPSPITINTNIPFYSQALGYSSRELAKYNGLKLK